MTATRRMFDTDMVPGLYENEFRPPSLGRDGTVVWMHSYGSLQLYGGCLLLSMYTPGQLRHRPPRRETPLARHDQTISKF